MAAPMLKLLLTLIVAFLVIRFAPQVFAGGLVLGMIVFLTFRGGA